MGRLELPGRAVTPPRPASPPCPRSANPASTDSAPNGKDAGGTGSAIRPLYVPRVRHVASMLLRLHVKVGPDGAGPEGHTAAVTIKIGTSGWQYRHWRGTFYPGGMGTTHWLSFYTSYFDTVEVNNAFYRLPEASAFERWRESTPPGFEMAVKMSSYLTHNRRLREPAEPVHRFLDRARHLGDKLGPILLQLPPTMPAEIGRLEETLSCLGSSVRVAVEVRHESWDRDEVFDVLAAHNAAWVIADAPWRRWPVVRTADWGYLRFHQGRASPQPCYGRKALAGWARRVTALFPDEADVYAYFNNDPCACALRDARWFASAVGRAGRTPTRVPPRGVVHLCDPGRTAAVPG